VGEDKALEPNKFRGLHPPLDQLEGSNKVLMHIRNLFESYDSSFAYPAFNTQNLETTLGIVQAAEELDTPVILATSEGTAGYAGLETIAGIVKSVASRSKAAIVLHFDHGKDIGRIQHAIDLGYSSVMIDHSYLPFEENMRDTRQVVEFAHERGAWVQGEIGRMRGTEDWVSVSEAETLLTDPGDALRFYRATSVDTLACSVGTIHGIIKMRGGVKPHVDIARIKSIHDLVKVPLVLHGASGVDPETTTLAIKSGISVINIDTELRIAYAQALRASLEIYPEEVDPRRILKPAITAVKEMAMAKIRQFGTRKLPAVA
jgi:fructose-bisphosphate aldolase class II